MQNATVRLPIVNIGRRAENIVGAVSRHELVKIVVATCHERHAIHASDEADSRTVARAQESHKGYKQEHVEMEATNP